MRRSRLRLRQLRQPLTRKNLPPKKLKKLCKLHAVLGSDVFSLGPSGHSGSRRCQGAKTKALGVPPLRLIHFL